MGGVDEGGPGCGDVCFTTVIGSFVNNQADIIVFRRIGVAVVKLRES